MNGFDLRPALRLFLIRPRGEEEEKEILVQQCFTAAFCFSFFPLHGSVSRDDRRGPRHLFRHVRLP